jgi:AraC-like DNA-binding protein
MDPYTPIVSEITGYSGKVYPRQKQRWPEHMHSLCQFDLTFSGEVFVAIEGTKKIRMRRCDGLFIPPLVKHSHSTQTGFGIVMFYFHAAPRYWRLLGENAFSVRIPEFVMRCVEHAADAKKQGSPLAEQLGAAALTLCLVEAIGTRKVPNNMPERTGFRARLWHLLERVERDPYGNWTVAGLARECHVSPDYFGRFFKQAVNCSPQDYLSRVRLRAAAQELAADADKSIKETAAESGYANVHAFTRAFRREIGISPAAYRRMPKGF